jgi:hypothetical protein
MGYSKSVVASIKRIYDVQIMDYDARNSARVDYRKGDYIKQLVKLMSKGAIEVKPLTSDLQFFFIRGGAEGFLDDARYSAVDASNVVIGGSTTSGGSGTTMVFDMTNLLTVFDRHGDLVSSALLERPLSITVPPPVPAGFNGWSEDAAKKVVDAWDNCKVNLYYNDNPRYEVKYFGLQVDDSQDYYKNHRYMVDFHKQEDTNGCIFIVDDSTPPVPDGSLPAAQRKAALALLNSFEPKFIKDVQAKIKAKTGFPVGTMRVVRMY